MNNSIEINRMPLFAFAAGSVILLTAVLMSGSERAGLIALEDGPAEYLQAIFYVAGMIASIWALTRGYHKLLASVWAIICLVFFGEETSWLQRVFDYSVPSVEQNSAQGEFNLHNQYIFGEGRLLDKDGNLDISISSLMNSQNLFRLGFFTYFLVIPVLCMWRPFANFVGRLGYVVPPWQVLAIIWPFVAVTFVFTAMHVEPMKFYIAEVRETIYAATIFIYCMTIVATGKAAERCKQRFARVLEA